MKHLCMIFLASLTIFFVGCSSRPAEPSSSVSPSLSSTMQTSSVGEETCYLVKTEEDFLERYKALTVGIKSLPYVCGYCYTQLSDVQQEKNGFLTEERRFKVNPEKIRAINDLPEGVFWNKKGH